ncbi:MAG: type IX secretion system outer membrane channel protein PorV [Saprospiraceae bacterium]|nr:type IX secretion system outer membrane channel protein PorV [Bacteroidia bacterium]NNL92018.1 type IX secretion system outer membrane channel protein PorV [Saprospiraceae bacterium]
MKHTIAILSVFLFLNVSTTDAQFDPIKRCVIDANGDCLPTAILTAMPFLRIIPDARGGAMGDVGITTSADPNSLHYNSSKLAFVEKDMSFSATYTPWLRNLGLQDVYLTYLTGYKKVDDLQSLGFGLRFFSLGEINFTDFDGQPSGTGKPREIEFAVSYNRKLSENFSMGLSAKYIYSNLASGQQVQGVSISSANAFAADLSFTYKKKGNLTAFGSEWTFGGALTNLGSKVTYTRSQFKDFLPANLGLGAGLLLNLDDYNSMSFHLDINKLLVPSPQSPTIFDENGTEIINPDYDSDPEDTEPDYKQQSNFGAMINSFGDAQGGFSEELKEYNFSLGVEYWYNKQFAVRTGYYYEHEEKGDRQFLTVGLGLKYNVFAIDISYLVPTNNRRNPLDNTLRFTLQFDFEALTGDYSDEN